MTYDSEPGPLELKLDGTELALLLSATFMADHWLFEQAEARALLNSDNKREIRNLYERVSKESARILKAGGAYKSEVSPWTRDFIRRRARVVGVIQMTQMEASVLLLILRVCIEEFRENWKDFYIASPGNLDWYGIEFDDLWALDRRVGDLGGRFSSG